MRHFLRAAILCLPIFAAAPTSSVATAQGGAGGIADRLVNDPRVDALRPYGLALPPVVRGDKGVQFGKALRFTLKGHADFWRIGVTTPTTRAIRKGDRIVVAFWARATGTDMNLPGRIGRVQLEETPVVRALFEKPFEIGAEWKMYQLSGRVERDYAPGQLNAALHVDAAKQVLDIGPVFVLDYGQDAS